MYAHVGVVFSVCVDGVMMSYDVREGQGRRNSGLKRHFLFRNTLVSNRAATTPTWRRLLIEVDAGCKDAAAEEDTRDRPLCTEAWRSAIFRGRREAV